MEYWVKSCQQSNNGVKKNNFNYSVSCLKLGSDLPLSIELQGFPGSVLVRASRDLNTDDYWGNLAESPLELAQTLDTISFTINQQKQITSKSLQAVAAIIAHRSCATHTHIYVHTCTYCTYTDTAQMHTLMKSHTNARTKTQIHCRDFCPINMHAKQFRTQQDVFVWLLQGNLALLFPHKPAMEGGEQEAKRG